MSPSHWHELCLIIFLMGWIPRQLAPELCYHVRVQCNNRAFRFTTEDDFQQYLEILLSKRKQLGFLLNDLVLMSTHIHLILTTPGPTLLDRIMQQINRSYALNYHRRHHRMGHFWMHGYRASVIDSDGYALTCMRYLHRNPPRAGLVTEPLQWKWSGYAFYAHGQGYIPLDTHPSYLGIASTDQQRQETYRDFVHTLLPTDEERERATIHRALERYRNPRGK